MSLAKAPATKTSQNFSNFVLQSIALPCKVRCMQIQNEAEEHLRVIRSLMEKATIYRAVSAPTALAGGIAAVIVAAPPVQNLFAQWAYADSFRARWLLALLATLVTNALLIFREARRRGDLLISPGMRAALQALLPPMLCGGVFFAIFGPAHIPAFLAMFYGLGLLATGHFAPRSIVWLGWSFLLAGLLTLVLSLTSWLSFGMVPDYVMVTTFGGFHFVYAACTWPRRTQTAALSGSP